MFGSFNKIENRTVKFKSTQTSKIQTYQIKYQNFSITTFILKKVGTSVPTVKRPQFDTLFTDNGTTMFFSKKCFGKPPQNVKIWILYDNKSQVYNFNTAVAPKPVFRRCASYRHFAKVIVFS
jgi:hypothetical protein